MSGFKRKPKISTEAGAARMNGKLIFRRGTLTVGLVPALLLIAMLILQPAGMALTSLLGAAIHEGGHLLAAKKLGVPLRSLDIGPLGATIRIRSGLISYGKEFLLCAAGPAANFVSAGTVYFLYRQSLAGEKFTVDFCTVSMMLGILNLFPVENFDGGRMLCCAVGSFFGPAAACSALRVFSFISVTGLWMLSVYLLLRFGCSLSLFVFTLSLFYRIYIHKE